MNESSDTEDLQLINRREAIRRVSALLGGVAFVGGSSLLTAVEKAHSAVERILGKFSAQDVAYLDEIAETILPATKTPGARAVKTGAFMALMVTDCYSPAEQKVFLDGMRKVDQAMRKANGVSFMAAAPEQRLVLLTTLDHAQKRVMDDREAADRKRKGLSPVVRGDATEAKAESLPGNPVVAAESARREPAHYFRMMKELALLGFFTSKIGCSQALRYVEAPGRFDPCLPYTPGEPAWASHA
ncbi:MAG: gluconate 2-dehydrogenase subunit 3 family protein [Steroidobacteraceae bacterium]